MYRVEKKKKRKGENGIKENAGRLFLLENAGRNDRPTRLQRVRKRRRFSRFAVSRAATHYHIGRRRNYKIYGIIIIIIITIIILSPEYSVSLSVSTTLSLPFYRSFSVRPSISIPLSPPSRDSPPSFHLCLSVLPSLRLYPLSLSYCPSVSASLSFFFPRRSLFVAPTHKHSQIHTRTTRPFVYARNRRRRITIRTPTTRFPPSRVGIGTRRRT